MQRMGMPRDRSSVNVRPDVQKIFRASVKARLQVVQEVADVLLM